MKNNLILHSLFVISLFLLLLNDLYLKSEFSNMITGKLSDITGLIVFPIFIAHLFPKTKTWICLATGVLFLVWKTPFVTPIIDYIIQFLPFKIQRVIDYTDYLALLVLPFIHKLIGEYSKNLVRSTKTYAVRAIKFSIGIIAFFAICATTLPPPLEIPKGTVFIGKSFEIKKSKEDVINSIKAKGYNVDYYENKVDSTLLRPYQVWMSRQRWFWAGRLSQPSVWRP